MYKSILFAIISALLFCSTVSANSLVAYDNFDRTNSAMPYSDGGSLIGQFPGSEPDSIDFLGSSFIPTVSGIVTMLEIGLFRVGESNQSLTWSIHAADGISGNLGPALWSDSFDQEISTDAFTIASFNVTEGAYLQAGLEYWLVGSASPLNDTFLVWNFNSTGAVGDVRYDYFDNDIDTVSSVLFQDIDSGAMAIYVTSVPVPPAILLFASANLLLFRRLIKS